MFPSAHTLVAVGLTCAALALGVCFPPAASFCPELINYKRPTRDNQRPRDRRLSRAFKLS